MSSENIAQVVQAWMIVPDDTILHDGQLCRVNAIGQLATTAAKSFEITHWNARAGKYSKFRVRRNDLIARVVVS